jgi:hypothetical protein
VNIIKSSFKKKQYAISEFPLGEFGAGQHDREDVNLLDIGEM